MKNLFSTRLVCINLLFFCVFVLGITGKANAQFLYESNIGVFEIVPNEGTKGTVFTIRGKGFGDNAGEVTVGGGECIVEEWSDTELICKYLSLRNRAGIYDVVIATAYGETIVSEDGFALMVPEVDPLSIGNGVDGNTIVVTGKYFGTKNCDIRIFGRVPDLGADWMLNKPESWTMDEETGKSKSSFTVPSCLPFGTYSFEMMVENAFGVSNIVEGSFTLGPACEDMIYEGDYTITDAASLQGLAGYTEVTGNLSIVETSLDIIEGLECLTTVGGYLIISVNNDLISMDFSSLTSVGGMDIYLNGSLESMDFSSLTSVNDYLWIEENYSLLILNFGKLTNVGVLGIDYNDVLTTMDFSSLTSVMGDFWIVDNPHLCDSDAILLRDQVTIGGEQAIEGNGDC